MPENFNTHNTNELLAGVCSEIWNYTQILKFAGKIASGGHRLRQALDYDIKLILSHNKASLYQKHI